MPSRQRHTGLTFKPIPACLRLASDLHGLNLGSDAPSLHRIAKRVADYPDMIVLNAYPIVERMMHVAMDPKPYFREAIRIEIVYEERVQGVSLEILMD